MLARNGGCGSVNDRYSVHPERKNLHSVGIQPCDPRWLSDTFPCFFAAPPDRWNPPARGRGQGVHRKMQIELKAGEGREKKTARKRDKRGVAMNRVMFLVSPDGSDIFLQNSAAQWCSS